MSKDNFNKITQFMELYVLSKQYFLENYRIQMTENMDYTTYKVNLYM